MTKKKRYGILSIIAVCCTLIWLGATIFVGVNIANARVEYETVEAQIVHYEDDAVTGRIATKHMVFTVEYQGQQYELNGVTGSEYGRYESAGVFHKPVTVYFCNGKMYSNLNGVKSGGTGLGKYYSYLLPGTFIMIVVSSVLIGFYVDERKKERVRNQNQQ